MDIKPKLICIVGETASGKDTVVNETIRRFYDYRIRQVCSYTDRPMRNNETNGVEHYFITTDEFNELKENRKNDILAYTHIIDENNPNSQGYQYMALTDEVNKSQIYIIDYIGLKNLKEMHGDSISIVSVYITAPYETRMNRAKERSDFNTSFKKRVENEQAQFDEFSESREYDYKIINNDGCLERSIDRLYFILNRELFETEISNFPAYTSFSTSVTKKTNS